MASLWRFAGTDTRAALGAQYAPSPPDRCRMTHASLDLNQPVGDEVKSTTCYMCACRCGIKVHLKDGRIRYIQGNREHPVNKGVICAKGSAGIAQHYSPARLSAPLLRVGERGSGEFKEISWDEALGLATQWLGAIRQRNPDELAFFTGRDQSQALTGWWAQQFGTINYAAHGGFCSVNMAAGGLYSIGGSFWEFGEPDWEHTKYLMLWGVAEDHDSNPIKIGLGKLKERGAKIVAINPIQSGYGAIADEWIGIRPGTDGLLAAALIHELLRSDRIDLDYLVRYTNAHWLVIRAPGRDDDGLFARDADGRVLCGLRPSHAVAPGAPNIALAPADAVGIEPAVVGDFILRDGRHAVPAFQLMAERFLDPEYAPAAVAERCGIDAATIQRLAAELADVAFKQAISLPIPWTDHAGREHAQMIGRPVAMHAMRGISAHSNGFHTCRLLHVLQMLLGAIDTPGSFRYQPPFPKPIPPPNRPGRHRDPAGVLNAAPLGFPQSPADLLVDPQGKPQRIDKAFSWEYPLAAHGMLHTVIRNAWAGDPYPIDTLLLFMANMSWNSSMATKDTMAMLTDRDAASGEYKIPHIIYSDAYSSEMVAYADLVLPDTTYLERHDCISLLDRPISDADGAADGIRQPVVEPDRDVRAFQSVLLDLGARLRLPGMITDAGAAKFPGGFAQYMVEHERAPGVGLLAGWRGAEGDRHGKGAPNPDQLKRYVANGCFWREEIPERARYYKMANRDYLRWALEKGFMPPDLDRGVDASQIPAAAPVVLQLYSETLQRFRLAALGHGPQQPPEADRARVARYFDPLPFWYEPFEQQLVDKTRFTLSALTQRPMFMYHAWGSQNRWLRQIAARNVLYIHPDTAAAQGIADDDWVWVESHLGRIKVQARRHAGVERNTVWSWNAIGKRRGAWALGAHAPEGKQGFLLNHVISDRLPDVGDTGKTPDAPQRRYANADPVTGQAAWFDLRVRIVKADAGDGCSEPQFPALKQRER
jgi:sulfite dehydrogenase (quinone) subunit SoeA